MASRFRSQLFKMCVARPMAGNGGGGVSGGGYVRQRRGVR